MVGTGGVDAMFITDHLPELLEKINEPLTARVPAYYSPASTILIPGTLFLSLASPVSACHAPPLDTPTPGKATAFTAEDVE